MLKHAKWIGLAVIQPLPQLGQPVSAKPGIQPVGLPGPPGRIRQVVHNH